MKLWPRSLFGRLALILLLGLAAAQALSFWLVAAERGRAMQSTMVAYFARDLASAVALLERLPAAERPAWLERLERRNYRYLLGEGSAGVPARSLLAQQVGQAAASALGPGYSVAMLQAGGGLRLALQLKDGTPLQVALAEPRLALSPWLLAALLVQWALLALLVWWAVRRAARPLAELARAADTLQPGTAAPVLAETGPSEVAQAAAAFNRMQRRIGEHLAERTQILAAISHDLQTPITRMRLRAELLEDAVLRDKLRADLEAMEVLVREGIAYARSAHGAAEPACPVDLMALLDSLACDYADSGHPVELAGAVAAPLHTRPQALRRIVTNLVDNALKFAGAAQIHAQDTGAGVQVEVLDRGPGIAPGELEAVLLPFHRLEDSRSRDTGGTGLGLAIALQLAQALGGSLSLHNREGGGLCARLVLPRVR